MYEMIVTQSLSTTKYSVTTHIIFPYKNEKREIYNAENPGNESREKLSLDGYEVLIGIGTISENFSLVSTFAVNL